MRCIYQALLGSPVSPLTLFIDLSIPTFSSWPSECTRHRNWILQTGSKECQLNNQMLNKTVNWFHPVFSVKLLDARAWSLILNASTDWHCRRVDHPIVRPSIVSKIIINWNYNIKCGNIERERKTDEAAEILLLAVVNFTVLFLATTQLAGRESMALGKSLLLCYQYW